MLVLAHPDEAESQQRTTLQIEGDRYLLPEQLGRPGFRIGLLGHVGQREVEVSRRVDDLKGPPLPLEERGAQRLVASDAVLEGGTDRLDVDGST